MSFIPLTGKSMSYWELLPLDRVLAKVSADTARRAGTNDIFYLDQAWVGRFANDTVPVQKIGSPGRTSSTPVNDFGRTFLRHSSAYRGRTTVRSWASLRHSDPVLLYRRDILERLRLPLPKRSAPSIS